MPATHPPQELPPNTRAYAARGATTPLAPFALRRRDPLPKDVEIDILFCGVCHSDLHTVRNEWKDASYPVVPGHEIVGRVTRVGREVKKFKEGDVAAVGCMVDSCRVCPNCQRGQEQFCIRRPVFTYNVKDAHTGGMTYGGYSERIVVDEAYTLKMPQGLDPASAAPLLCAGITTYSPMRHWKIARGQKVGVIGLGGLGHVAVKIAHAMEAHVVVFTTSPGKTADAKRLGADEVVVSKNAAEMAAHTGSFDFILDTASADHDLNAYLNLLRVDGTLTLVGAPEHPLPVAAFSLIPGRRSLSGSCIGGIAETQEMLNFCAERKIACDIEMIPIQQINEAYDRLVKGQVKYRFVIDMASLKNEKAL